MRLLAAALLGLATVAARTAHADPPPAPKHAAETPAQRPGTAPATAAPQGRNEQAISKLKELGKRETERLAPRAGRAEKVVRDQAPKAIDQLVDWAAQWTGAEPAKKPVEPPKKP